MLADALREFYLYGDEALRRLLTAAGRVTPEQWVMPSAGGQPSLRDTVVHVVSSQRSWLASWEGILTPVEAMAWNLDPAEYPDAASLVAEAGDVHDRTMRFLAGHDDASLHRLLVVELPDGGRWASRFRWMLLHVANHGTQHRSKAAWMLTQYGQSPGEIDLIYHFDRLGEAALAASSKA